MNKTEQKAADKIADIRDAIQAFMDKNITTYEGRMSGPAIYEAMGDAVGDVTKQDFQLGLSISIRNGLITGFRGIRGRNGGYCPTDSEDDGGGGNSDGRIVLGNGAVMTFDPLNWCLEGIGPKRYWSSFPVAIKQATKLLVENEIKLLIKGEVSIDDLVELVAKAEENIAKRLEVLMPQKPAKTTVDEDEEDDEG